MKKQATSHSSKKPARLKLLDTTRDVAAPKKEIATYKNKLESGILSSGKSLFGVCLRQDYHEGDKLFAQLDLVEESPEVDVLVSGILYRSSLEVTDELSRDEAYVKAKSLGDDWVEKYAPRILASRSKMTVYPWELWLFSEKYNKLRNEIEEYYLKDQAFKDAFDHEVDKFIERESQKHEIKDREKAVDACLEYLFEEVTVLIIHFRERPYRFFVYPGSKSEAIEAAFKKYNLPIKIILTTFDSPKTKLISLQTTPLVNRERVREIDKRALESADRRKVLISSHVFHIGGAIASIRHAYADNIESSLFDKGPFDVFRESDRKSTMLIFSPPGKYEKSKFANGEWKKYIPSKRALDSNPDCLKQGNISITLRDAQLKEAINWRGYLDVIGGVFDIDSLSAEDVKKICMAIDFYYQFLMYKTSAPEARILIKQGEGGKWLLFFTYLYPVADIDLFIDEIKKYLLNFDSNIDLDLVEMVIEGETEPRKLLQVIDPLSIAMHIFGMCKRLNLESGVTSVPSTPISSRPGSPGAGYITQLPNPNSVFTAGAYGPDPFQLPESVSRSSSQEYTLSFPPLPSPSKRSSSSTFFSSGSVTSSPTHRASSMLNGVASASLRPGSRNTSPVKPATAQPMAHSIKIAPRPELQRAADVSEQDMQIYDMLDTLRNMTNTLQGMLSNSTFTSDFEDSTTLGNLSEPIGLSRSSTRETLVLPTSPTFLPSRSSSNSSLGRFQPIPSSSPNTTPGASPTFGASSMTMVMGASISASGELKPSMCLTGFTELRDLHSPSFVPAAREVTSLKDMRDNLNAMLSNLRSMQMGSTDADVKRTDASATLAPT